MKNHARRNSETHRGSGNSCPVNGWSCVLFAQAHRIKREQIGCWKKYSQHDDFKRSVQRHLHMQVDGRLRQMETLDITFRTFDHFQSYRFVLFGHRSMITIRVGTRFKNVGVKRFHACTIRNF